MNCPPVVILSLSIFTVTIVILTFLDIEREKRINEKISELKERNVIELRNLQMKLRNIQRK